MEALDAHTAMSTQALNSEDVRRGLKDVLLDRAGLYESLRGGRGGGLRRNWPCEAEPPPKVAIPRRRFYISHPGRCFTPVTPRASPRRPPPASHLPPPASPPRPLPPAESPAPSAR
jgi:hypothetical protein